MAEPYPWAVAPVLRVADVRASVAYYVDKLGFECAPEGIVDGGGDEGAIYGIVRRGEIAIHLGRKRDEHEIDAGIAPNALGAYVFVPDVHEIYAEFQRRGADLVQEPRVQPYGLEDITVRDLDGYHLGFGAAPRD